MEQKEYQVIQPIYDKKIKKKYWETAIGLQKVDGLKPSNYLLSLAEKNIEGDMSNYEVKESLNAYYSDLESGSNLINYECDIVSQRIVELLEPGSFSFSPAMLKSIHKYLFKDILKSEDIGTFRNQNIYKKEPILHGRTVNYANYYAIEELFDYDFEHERNHKYSQKPTKEEIKNLTQFTSSIWQIHPFMEGNTRTTAVFIELYLRNIGFNIDNVPFKDNSDYFRNALVRSNYSDINSHIVPVQDYLFKFYENLFYKNKNVLNNQELFCTFQENNPMLDDELDL